VLIIAGIAIWTMLLSIGNPPVAVASPAFASGSQPVFLPLIQAPAIPPPATRRVYAPNYDPTMWFGGAGIVWFGKISPTENYADIRVGYTNATLYIRLTVFDRRIWCNTNPSATDPTLWDTIALNLRLTGNTGNAPDQKSYRLIAPFNAGVGCVAGNWATTFQGNGTSWTPTNVAFSIDNWYRGPTGAGPNQDADNQGWVLTYQIPFSSFGLNTPPAPGTTWGMSLTLYDRDDAAGTPIASKTWPENMVRDQPSTWGQLVFGLPLAYVAPRATPRTTVTIANGLNGATVPDGQVGGGLVCGQGLEVWTQWGQKNYAGQNQVNVQNQEDVSDWPCFSKYYITFPLSSIPAGKVIISSTVTLYQFGNAGQGWTPGPYRSLIQVSSVNEDWNENTLAWNNAPVASEYINETYVDPLDTTPPWPGVPRTFDVSSAVAKAYAAGIPLRLVFYSADGPMHSGKYFYSSDADPEGRPKLQVLWGDP
jgi:hypothetical protein